MKNLGQYRGFCCLNVRYWPKADTRIIAEYEEIGSDLEKTGEFFWEKNRVINQLKSGIAGPLNR
jgi:hypothetical protein